jgi:hypothetical protein
MAANAFAFCQAKGIKGSIASSERELRALLAPQQGTNAEVALIGIGIGVMAFQI